MDILISLDREVGPMLDKWDGSLDKFETLIPNVIDNCCHLYYKEHFVLNKPKYINKVMFEQELSVMESRIINVIKSMTQRVSEFYLPDVIELIDEENKDLVIIGIESVIAKELIIPAPKST
jgi:hypothetical protein